MGTLRIDENYSIESDENNCTLLFNETRERKNKKTGGTENYEVTDQWYYPTVNHCLKKYLDVIQRKATTIEEVIELTNSTYEKIKQLKF